MITIQDLAKSCGVSVATISRAFSPNGKINSHTRELILQKAKELNYVPNTIARSLQSKQTNSIGIIVPEITNSFYFSVIQRMEYQYREKGYHFVIGFYQRGLSCESDIIENMASCRVDALIFSPTDRKSETVLKRCFPQGNILQLFCKTYDEYPSLVIDDIAGTANAVEYLISQGHSKILYYGEQSRSVGYTETMKKHGIDISDLYYPSYFLEAFDAGECIKKANPTAILAIAKWSESVVSALHRMGLRIPDDVSLIAYDDVEWTRMLDITTVSHPLDSIAAVSIEILLKGLSDGSVILPVHKQINPYLVIRDSVKQI